MTDENVEFDPESLVSEDDDIPTTPELLVQIKKNVVISKETCAQASSVLVELEKRTSSNPPKL